MFALCLTVLGQLNIHFMPLKTLQTIDLICLPENIVCFLPLIFCRYTLMSIILPRVVLLPKEKSILSPSKKQIFHQNRLAATRIGL